MASGCQYDPKQGHIRVLLVTGQEQHWKVIEKWCQHGDTCTASHQGTIPKWVATDVADAFPHSSYDCITPTD
jgi:hypothetical protein